MKIRGKEYDEQQFTNDIQRHIDWLWPLPPNVWRKTAKLPFFYV